MVRRAFATFKRARHVQHTGRMARLLFEAHAADHIPYIERLAEYSGELCGSRELASDRADRLIGITRLALSPDRSTRGYFHGTSACMSALFTAERETN